VTPRARFIADADIKKIAARAWDASMQASSHDPEHAAELVKLSKLIYAEVKLQDRRFTDICARLSVLERIGTIRKGKK
jgi:hypothetical protein